MLYIKISNIIYKTNWSNYNFTEIAAVSYEKDEVAKAEKFVPLTNETIPFYLEKLDAIVKENNGYFALGKVTSMIAYNIRIKID